MESIDNFGTVSVLFISSSWFCVTLLRSVVFLHVEHFHAKWACMSFIFLGPKKEKNLPLSLPCHIAGLEMNGGFKRILPISY